MTKIKKVKKVAKSDTALDSETKLSSAEAKKLYREMLLIRRFEEKAGQLYGMGLIGGFCHLYIGQEAIVAGLKSVHEPQDTVITAYRNHGHVLLYGVSARAAMAELTGRSTGCSRGKGGSMHMFSVENNFYGGHGIVGAQVSMGTGLAFAHKYKNDNGVCLSYMGDGAADQGQVAESYNMAALWKLPVLYIIENNQYSMGTSTKRHAAGDLYRRGEGFGIPGEQVDGMDILALRETAKQALDYVRSGEGPYILEIMTYRYRGHSMSDPAKYRSKEELADIKDNRDPIKNFKALLLNEMKINEDEIKEIEKEVKEIVRDAADFAQQSSLPDESELWTDILLPVESVA